MTLLDRINANRCAVVDCDRQRLPDSMVCRDDLLELWNNRLVREGEVYVRRRVFRVRDDSGWIRERAA